jgi:hypothetical protein
MRISLKRSKKIRAQLRPRRRSFERLEDRVLLAGDVVMYNDHIGGAGTHAFTTTYATVGVSSGLLRDSATGATTNILLQTQAAGAAYETVVGLPSPATDAHTIFNGWVDFSSQANSSIALFGTDTYTHAFSGLNPQRSYEFAGTSVRGEAGYTNRWTLVTLVGADSFTAAHSSGLGIVTDGLPPNQVALWTGENHLPDQGFVAQWRDINPGEDGAFQIVSEQYVGLTPGVGTGSAATGSKAYALTAVRLVERDPTFRVSSSDPASGSVFTTAPTNYTVNFSAPVNAATVQASDLTVDGLPATALQVVDEDTVQFTLPVVGGQGFHNVAIAEGAIQSSAGAPLVAFAASFAIFSGSGVVINEISYDTGSDADPWEYIELFNAGGAPVDLSGWRLAGGVSYTIPGGTVVGSGQYLLVSQHPAQLMTRYGVSSLGPFSGRLSNEADQLELLDADGDVQDLVDYQIGFPWPTVGDIAGRSIQLINPMFDNALGGNWRSAPVTPRAANSVFAINAAPQMRQVNHSPQAPVAGQDVMITMKVTDPEGVSSVSLQYQVVDPGDYIAINDPRYATLWTTVAMRDDGTSGDVTAGDDIYTAVLPGSLQTHRRLVRYRVTAADTPGATIRVPYADDPQPNFVYFVYNGVPSWTGAARPGVTPQVNYSSELLDSIATYQLITTRQSHVDSQFIPGTTRGSGYGGEDYLWHGALVYDGVVYDHIRYRARGGVWRYAMGKNMWKFDFNRGHPFEARDSYGNKYEVPWNKLNLGSNIQQGDFWHRGEQGLFESVGFKLFDLAGVPASQTNYVHFRIVENASETGANQYSSDFQGLYLAVEELDDQFLEEHDLPDGNLYKMENGTGVPGASGEIANQGDYPAVKNSSDLVGFRSTYLNPPAETADWWKQNFNLDSYYNYRSIVEAIHHYDIGAGKNYFYYLNPETNKWETLPWDIDLTWANNMYGDGNEPFRSRVLAIPEFAVAYRNRMREIRDLLYNPEQAGLVIDEVASFVYEPGQPSWVDADRAMWDYNPILVSPQVNQGKAGHGRFYAGGGGIQIPAPGGFPGMMQVLKNYVVSRGAFIDATILTDDSQVPVRPTINYSGQPGFPVDGLQFTSSPFSSSNSSFVAMEWRIAEVYHSGTPGYEPGTEWKYEIDAVWESGELTTFDNTLDSSGAGLLPGHTYRARVRMKDAAGRWSHWSAPVEFVAAPPAAAPSLAITEIHYHPNNPVLADESDQEYIEIKNIGSQVFNLSGVQITDFANPPYVFADGLSLAPGQYIVVTRTPAVFTSIYGDGINLAPGGYGEDNLSNSGETIALRDASGGLIFSVTYSDASPWPSAADGGGPSLEIINPQGGGDNPANWRASHYDGGTPGMDGAPPPAVAGDYDFSGAVELQDYTHWKASFGKNMPPGGGADGNANRVVDAADYVLWRKNLGAQPAAAMAAAVLAVPPEVELGVTQAVAAAIVAAPIQQTGPHESEALLQRRSAIDLVLGTRGNSAEPLEGSRRNRVQFEVLDRRLDRSDVLLTLAQAFRFGASGAAENAAETGDPRKQSRVDTVDAAEDFFASLGREGPAASAVLRGMPV